MAKSQHTSGRNWLTNGLWVSNFTTTVFSPGDMVLFDLTGSNSLPVGLASTLSPAKVTVNSPGDYVLNGPGSLAGTMGLVKAGAGTLTLNGTSTLNLYEPGTTTPCEATNRNAPSSCWAMPTVKGLNTDPANPAAAPRKGIAVPTSES